MTGDQPGGFSVRVRSGATQTVVGVQGELDRLSAPRLAEILDLIVESGQPGVVLDLAELTLVDDAGLRVIAAAAANLKATSQELTLRLAGLSGTGALLPLEASGVSVVDGWDRPRATLGVEELQGDRSRAVEPARTDLCEDLARVGAMRASDEMIDAALELVTALAGATVGGADGVSVTLDRRGRLMTVASTNETILRMDSTQYSTGEGPCLSAAAEGRWFHSESLREETRWPAFLPGARDEGIASILSTPLMTADRSIGALNIYSNTERAFGPREQELAALFATHASGILARGGAGVTDEQLSTRIAAALLERETIAHAQGVLMERDDLTAEEAATALHRGARDAHLSVLPFAAGILTSTPRPNRSRPREEQR